VPIFLSETLEFPDPTSASEDGLLAIGGDLSVERLLLAYRNGIFPWYSDNQPILWWSPNPRMVLFPEKFKVSKSLLKKINNNEFRITFNQNFKEVIANCSAIKRKEQNGTWITSEMQESYIKLHKKGFAVSVEVWNKDELVGGLYGIDLHDSKIFCGESMFSKQTDASKIAFYFLVKKLSEEKYKLIDCQLYTAHLESLGAKEIPRKTFLKYLKSTT